MLDQRAAYAQGDADFTAAQFANDVARPKRPDDVFHVPFS
jgi:hypothetical protein